MKSYLSGIVLTASRVMKHTVLGGAFPFHSEYVNLASTVLISHSRRGQEPHEVLYGSSCFIPPSCFLRCSPSRHLWVQSCCDR